MGLALSSTSQTHTEISRLAEDTLADRLRGIDGVSQVEISGSLNPKNAVAHVEMPRWRKDSNTEACPARGGSRSSLNVTRQGLSPVGFQLG